MINDVKTIVSLLMKRPITEEIVMQVASIPGYSHLEIKDGNWVLDTKEDEVGTGEEDGWIEVLIIYALTGYVLANKLGRVYPGDVAFILEGTLGDIRRQFEPDVFFVSQANVMPSAGFIYGAPDLAVEIVSPSQTENEMFEKAKEYFSHGTQVVWLILPRQKEIVVHTPGNALRYGLGDTIPGGDLLPGFSLSVTQVFES